MCGYPIIENGEKYSVDEPTYDRLITAEKIYFCDECNVAHAYENWADVEVFIQRESAE